MSRFVCAVIPLTDKISADAADCRLMSVLLSTSSLPIVCVGTFVAVDAPPLVKFRISEESGANREGDQLPGTVQSNDPDVGSHTYVCAPLLRSVKSFPP